LTEHREQRIYICSDSVGETAEAVVRATIRQFDAHQVKIRRFSHIKDEREIRRVLEEAAQAGGFVVFTLVQPELREFMKEEGARLGVRTVDIMGPMIQAFTDTFHDSPKREPGLLHELDDDYFRRVEAIEFAVKYDDGRDPKGMLQAQVVLIGISRTSKTPLSIFLAHKGLKVANLPLIPEVRPPTELFQIPSRNIFGLTMDIESMLRVRIERLKALGLPDGSRYANRNRVAEELAYANELMEKLGCNVINVTNKAIEETAGIIMGYFAN
jgi:hypothetical protein